MAVVLLTSRLIFDVSRDARTATVAVRNKGERPLLVQVSVLDQQGGTKTAFVATPALMRLEGDTEQKVTVRRVKDDLPADRESAFQFKAKVIPPKGSGEAETTLAIPFFYRPANLAGDPAATPGRLSTNQEDGKLTLANPTPFFVTLASLSVGEDVLDIGDSAPIAPLGGTVSYALPSDTTGDVVWTAIGDSGDITPSYRQ
ncbi:molecular chaperone [Kitasatospora purpeofusca]|uniref:fimbrial biogenesis chaperone n=1 Tax=Kitasatospora purpeofusca TaxID=67352 RepID=UPI0030F1DBBD